MKIQPLLIAAVGCLACSFAYAGEVQTPARPQFSVDYAVRIEAYQQSSPFG
jgi:hypothetical protein